MKKKVIILIVLTCVSLGSIAACGEQNNNSAVTSDSETINDTEEITLLSTDSTSTEYQEFIKEAEDTLNIKINLQTASANADNRQAQFSNILASGDTSIDVLTLNDEMMSEFKTKGYLEPISEEVVPEDIRATYQQNYLHSIPMENGVLYSVPFYMDIIMYWVNQSILDDAGISEIKNLDDFETLLKADYREGVYGYGGSWERTYAYNEIDQFVNMMGGDYLDWNNPKSKSAVKFLHDMAEHGYTPKDQLVDQYDQMEQKFMEGKYASIFMYSGAMNTFVQENTYGSEKIHIVPLPNFGAGKTTVAAWQYVINRSSKHKAAAERFLSWCASDEGSIAYSRAMNRLPARIDIANESLNIPDIDIMRSYISNYELDAREFSSTPMQSVTEMGETFQLYITDQVSLDEFCQKAQIIVDE